MSNNLIGATLAEFTATLSAPVDRPVDVAWSTRDGTAKAGTHYEAANGVITFLPGETVKKVSVSVYAPKPTLATDKSFYIELSPPSNAVLATTSIEVVISLNSEGGVSILELVVPQGKRGLKGDPGLSAYEHAVLSGRFDGTEQEWLDEELRAGKAAQQAEAAATSATIAGKVYLTPAEGVNPSTGVPVGAYFNVRSSSDDSIVDEYRNINGVATPTGKSYPSAHKLNQTVADTQQSLSQIEQTANQAIASTQIYRDESMAFANQAEAAATAANIAGKVYPTPEAGVDPVTGVGNGAYYNVRSPDDDNYLVEYQNIGGVPTPTGKSYPSAQAISNKEDSKVVAGILVESSEWVENIPKLEKYNGGEDDTANVSAEALANRTKWLKEEGSKAQNHTIKNAQNPNAPAIIRSVQQELDNGMFDVTRMGAKGHATFDSTSAFLAAQEEAAYLGAKALYVPASANEYNIESSILNVSQGDKGIGLIGAGLNLTKLCWRGGAGRLINGFSAWQYGFSMKGFTLKTPATNKSQIVSGSVGIHLERTQSPGLISDILVQGFDTNIDIGVHAQFLTWQNIQSRQGNILLNAYGQNADLNVFDNCSFYAPVKKGVLLSAPRIVMRDCWFGTTSAWSNPDAVDITIGFQQVRAEDIGKSATTTDPQYGHHAQFGALIRPRFENNLSGTAPYIEFKDIDERTGSTVLRPFTIDNPIMQNTGMNACIRVADNREGIRIIAPEKVHQIPYLIDDVTQTDGSVQYISIVDDKSHNTYMGQSSYAKFNQSFYFNSTVVNKTTELIAGSSATFTLDEVNKVCKVSKSQSSSTELARVVRPASANTAKFFIQASKLSLGVVDVAIYSSGTNYKFRMRNIPVEKLRDGISIEIPNSENTSLTLSVATVANTSGEIIFEKVLMNA